MLYKTKFCDKTVPRLEATKFSIGEVVKARVHKNKIVKIIGIKCYTKQGLCSEISPKNVIYISLPVESRDLSEKVYYYESELDKFVDSPVATVKPSEPNLVESVPPTVIKPKC